ncbi:MAG: M42 family metallopeptidase [Candidatus Hodarchaeales archaeon]
MNDTEIIKLIKNLAEIPGPVGREENVQKAIETQWKKHGLQIRYDKVGNLYGRIHGEGPHWAIVGHADSIGFVVQQILTSGFVRMAFNTAATTPDARFLAGVPLEFVNENDEIILAYFGLRSGHLAGIEGKKEPVLFNDLFVDFGVDSYQDVRNLGIDVGTPAVFGTPIKQFQQNLVGKAMDNRVASTIQCILAKELQQQDSNPNITFISTVQEEIGMKGAASASKDSDFDGVINIDVGLTGDIPTAKEDHIPTKLGKGPIIIYKDFSIHYSKKIIQKLETSATKNQIPYQKAVFKNYNTDGQFFFMQGQPTSTVAIPCRYTHTYFETVRISDIEHTISLIVELFSS